MANYVITRDQLKKRFASGGASEKESGLIISAIFSYLEMVSSSITSQPFVDKVISLVFYDFRFLYSLYTDDSFARKFFSIYRDVQSKLITFSDQANLNDHIIRDSTGLGDGTNGLYLYILNFDKHMTTAVNSLRNEYTIENPGESIFSLSNGRATKPLFLKSPVVPRTDDRRSYTDSVMNASPAVPLLTDTSVLPDDYKYSSDTISDDSVPFLNGQPGTKSMSKIRTSGSNPVKSDSSKQSDSQSRLERTDLKEYPVLNFILSSSRARQ